MKFSTGPGEAASADWVDAAGSDWRHPLRSAAATSQEHIARKTAARREDRRCIRKESSR
jgi:hypothetical protein